MRLSTQFHSHSLHPLVVGVCVREVSFQALKNKETSTISLSLLLGYVTQLLLLLLLLVSSQLSSPLPPRQRKKKSKQQSVTESKGLCVSSLACLNNDDDDDDVTHSRVFLSL